MPRLLDRVVRWARGHEHTFMFALAAAVGLLGGLGAVGFRWLIAAIQRIGWGTWDFRVEDALDKPWWWVIAVPAAGGAVVGPLVYFLAREAKGHGVPEVMEAVALRSGLIRARVVLVKSLASALSIGSGGSVGREGPIVQIGSALGSTIGQWLRVSGTRLKTLVGCGAAAGIAATFNAPIAGPIFAAEVILGDFGVSQFSPIVISSVVATVVSRACLGDAPAFVVPAYPLQHPVELLFYVLLGVLAALVGLAFVRVLYGAEDLAEKIPVPPWLLTPLGFAAIGAIGLFRPEIFGVGYDTIERALHGEIALKALVVLLVVKMLATSLTIAAGGSGGVFAPSLFLGAMCGGAVGWLAGEAIPGAAADQGAYALVGMGAVVAATTHAPLTAILILFELTSDYKLILPIMASCIIATLVATRLRRESIYTMKLIRRGVDIRRGREVNVLRSIRVRSAMSRDAVRLDANQPLGAILETVTGSLASQFYVTEKDGRLVGVVSLADLTAALPEADVLRNLILARDLARTDVPAAREDQTLDVVTRLLDGRNREELPVVGEDGRLLGSISRADVIAAYNRELMRRDMAQELTSSVFAAEAARREPVALGSGVVIAEIDAPGALAGRTLREMDVRRRFGLQVLLVRRNGREDGESPGPDTRIELGDRLVVMGSENDIARARRAV